MESITPRLPPPVNGRLAPTVRPWANLSPDLLLDVSNRLDDPTDFVRFHAVCMPWRNAAPSLHAPAATRPTFSPWLLALCGTQVIHSTVATDGGEGMLVEPTSSTAGGRNWVARADGTAAWFLVASPQPRLVHLLTGAVTVLPHFPDRDEIIVPMEHARGIVYSDGTVFLYKFLYKERTSTFMATILRAGDMAWRVMRRIWDVPTTLSSAMYHDGKILVSFGEYFWSVLTGGVGDLRGLQSRWNGAEERNFSRECNYVLESRGELLWASVLVKRDGIYGYARADITPSLSVTVHILEKGAGGVMQWVLMDGWRLADRVLFLGSPASFAVDADQLGVGGGCAYFVFRHCVFWYGVIDGEGELVKRLPRRWGSDGAGVWLRPEPTIVPIQEIRKGLMKQKMKWDVLGIYS